MPRFSSGGASAGDDSGDGGSGRTDSSEPQTTSPGGSGSGSGFTQGDSTTGGTTDTEPQSPPKTTSPGGSGGGSGFTKGGSSTPSDSTESTSQDASFSQGDTNGGQQQQGFVDKATTFATAPAQAAAERVPSVSEIRQSEQVQAFRSFQAEQQTRVQEGLSGVRGALGAPTEREIVSDVQSGISERIGYRPRQRFQRDVQQPAQQRYEQSVREPAVEAAQSAANTITSPGGQATFGAIATLEPTPFGEVGLFGAAAAASAVAGTEIETPDSGSPFQERPELGVPDANQFGRDTEIAVPQGDRQTAEIPVDGEPGGVQGTELPVPSESPQQGEVGIPSLRAAKLRGRQIGREESRRERQRGTDRFRRNRGSDRDELEEILRGPEDATIGEEEYQEPEITEESDEMYYPSDRGGVREIYTEESETVEQQTVQPELEQSQSTGFGTGSSGADVFGPLTREQERTQQSAREIPDQSNMLNLNQPQAVDQPQDTLQGQPLQFDQPTQLRLGQPELVGSGTATETPPEYENPNVREEGYATPAVTETNFDTRRFDLPEFPDADSDDRKREDEGVAAPEFVDFFNPLTGEVLETERDGEETSFPWF